MSSPLTQSATDTTVEPALHTPIATADPQASWLSDAEERRAAKSMRISSDDKEETPEEDSEHTQVFWAAQRKRASMNMQTWLDAQDKTWSDAQQKNDESVAGSDVAACSDVTDVSEIDRDLGNAGEKWDAELASLQVRADDMHVDTRNAYAFIEEKIDAVAAMQAENARAADIKRASVYSRIRDLQRWVAFQVTFTFLYGLCVD